MQLIVYYSMAPLQSNCNIAPSNMMKVKTTKHPIGEWPIYLYHFDPIDINTNEENTNSAVV